MMLDDPVENIFVTVELHGRLFVVFDRDDAIRVEGMVEGTWRRLLELSKRTAQEDLAAELEPLLLPFILEARL